MLQTLHTTIDHETCDMIESSDRDYVTGISQYIS